MLSRLSRFFLLLLMVMLVSCTVTEEKQIEPQSILETNTYSAWNLSSGDKRMVDSNRALRVLLVQADDLINQSNFDLASDKLERLVRIEPQFAQAWSRLAWLALKNNNAQRSQQLAQRSNSYSRNNNDLKILNWHFIQKAAEQIDNAVVVQQAKKMIKKLGNQ